MGEMRCVFCEAVAGREKYHPVGGSFGLLDRA